MIEDDAETPDVDFGRYDGWAVADFKTFGRQIPIGARALRCEFDAAGLRVEELVGHNFRKAEVGDLDRTTNGAIGQQNVR